jgi:hypothetical protein
MNHVIFILVFVMTCSSKTIIKKRFPLCELSNEIISTEETCTQNDIECQLFMSQIEFAIENTFNTIETANTQIVIYKKNNKVYNTHCDIVNEIMIEQGISFADKTTCSHLLPVKYDSDRQVAFLRKDGVLVKDYDGVKCPVQEESFLIDDKEFILAGNF